MQAAPITAVVLSLALGAVIAAAGPVDRCATGNLAAISTAFARVRVTATATQTSTNDMVLIPAGAFAMGNGQAGGEGYADELPVHTVMVSAFHMDKHEVTSQQWFEVRHWALAHGYTFNNTGSGKAATHPAQSVNWYDCVKWCNARSEMQGLTPCYYTDAAQTLVYRGGQANLSNEWVQWMAHGYRLPTEAEWEKAARGGAVGMRFPWRDVNTITNARANYYGDTGYAYDAGPYGNNPLFTRGGMPYTSPVGYGVANGYGLYDMAGNVWEWCWDWYDENWYSNGRATHHDTHGPASGADRVMRGGGWDSHANYCRVTYRAGSRPGGNWSGYGFRCVAR